MLYLLFGRSCSINPQIGSDFTGVKEFYDNFGSSENSHLFRNILVDSATCTRCMHTGLSGPYVLFEFERYDNHSTHY